MYTVCTIVRHTNWGKYTIENTDSNIHSAKFKIKKKKQHKNRKDTILFDSVIDGLVMSDWTYN